LKVENRLLNDVVIKINEILTNVYSHNKSQPANPPSKDLNKTLENAQELINLLKVLLMGVPLLILLGKRKRGQGT